MESAFGVLLVAGLVLKTGCGGGFLGLEDYQRDLLFGGLAAALLLTQPADGTTTGTGGASGEGAGAPVPGADGERGLPGQDGQAGQDGVTGVQGPPGPQGEEGPQGPDGAEGPAGAEGPTGISCWDLNENGLADDDEDTNGDGVVNVDDCQGQDGIDGVDGTDGGGGGTGGQGPAGPAGPEFFGIFVDDFFIADPDAPSGNLQVVTVRIDEPVLGAADSESGSPGPIAYRVAIPDSYAPGNDVTMRLFFHRTGPVEGDCFIFTVDGVRLVSGSDVAAYGERRWIRVDNQPTEPTELSPGGIGNPGVTIVIDLPLNTAAGLGGPSLAAQDFLAFELATVLDDGGAYQILAAEFFESGPGTATLARATIIVSQEDVCCSALVAGPGLSVPDDHVFISDSGGLRISAIADLSPVADIEGTLSTDGGFDDGYHMVFDTAGQRLFVTEHDDPFHVFDAMTLTEIFPDTDVWVDDLILDEPLGIAPLPDGKLLITDEDAEDGLFRINADLTLDAQITVSVFDGCEGVAYDSIHDRILVADEDDGDIEIFDGPSLDYLGGTTLSCGSEGPYWIGVDGSTSRVFVVAEGSCFNEALESSVFGIHVFDFRVDCDVNELTFNRTLFGSRGQDIDCYGTLAVSESTDRLFAIDYCTDKSHPVPTVDIYDTGTLEFLGSVPIDRAGEAPLMVTVGHFDD